MWMDDFLIFYFFFSLLLSCPVDFQFLETFLFLLMEFFSNPILY